MLIVTRGRGDAELEPVGSGGGVKSTLNDMELEDVSDIVGEEYSYTI